MKAISFSKDGTLLIPMDLSKSNAENAWKDGSVVYLKKEHHVTLVGFGQGKAIKKVFAANPELQDKANALLAEFEKDIYIILEEECFFLERDGLKTIIHRVDVPGAKDIYKRLSQLLGIELEPQLLHVTFFTSDPAGKAGIGVNSEAELKDALEGVGKYKAFRAY